MATLSSPTVTLADGHSIPQLGYGVWQAGTDEVEPAVASALAAGHRHADTTEAWSPLGQGRGLLDDPTLGAIAAAHGATPAQVALAWQLAIGDIAIPKSVSPERMRENLASVELTLDADDLATALDRAARYGAAPETVTFTQMPS